MRNAPWPPVGMQAIWQELVAVVGGTVGNTTRSEVLRRGGLAENESARARWATELLGMLAAELRLAGLAQRIDTLPGRDITCRGDAIAMLSRAIYVQQHAPRLMQADAELQRLVALATATRAPASRAIATVLADLRNEVLNHAVTTTHGGTTPAERDRILSDDFGHGGVLLAAARELRSALEKPVPYPDRPGKTCISLSDDRAEHIRTVFAHALKTPAELPPGVSSKLLGLLNELLSLRFREIEDPNRLHLRAFDTLREIETALVSSREGANSNDQKKRLDNTAWDEGKKPKAEAKPDGPFDTDGFRFAGAEVRFGKAGKQYRLVMALWDAKQNRPAPPRPVEDVMSEVWGEEHTTGDSTFRQLCSDTRGRFQRSSCPLDIKPLQGQVQLVRV